MANALRPGIIPSFLYLFDRIHANTMNRTTTYLISQISIPANRPDFPQTHSIRGF